MAKVPFTLKHEAVLSEDELADLPAGGQKWWLRSGSDFVTLPKRVKGNEALDLVVHLEPGAYVLGVGPARGGGVRVDVVVDAPAEVPVAKVAPSGKIDVKAQNIVITGDLDCLDRDAAKAWLEDLGAKVSSGVSKKTTLLVVGANAGATKLTKAAELGTKQITEAELIAAFGSPPTRDNIIAKGSTAGSQPELVAALLEKVDHADKKVQKYVGPARFRDLGLANNILWGISRGPQGGEYNVHIRLKDRLPWAVQCNCANRKPCVHGIALLVTAKNHFVPPAPAPAGHEEASRFVPGWE